MDAHEAVGLEERQHLRELAHVPEAAAGAEADQGVAAVRLQEEDVRRVDRPPGAFVEEQQDSLLAIGA